ncbi:SH3 domain-containing protein [Streptomyces sp. NPDC002764]|uniref:SH3 domain-containing protein n=1 Tax=unclassified Streptomyces TaxID=2593676 RepID=UPI00331B4D3D
MSLRSPRGTLTRLAIATAAGALLASVVATPALADDQGNGGGDQTAGRDNSWNGNGGGDQNAGSSDGWNGNGNGNGGGGQNAGGSDGWNGNGNGGGDQNAGSSDGWNGNGGGDQNAGGSGSWNGSGGHHNQNDPRLYRGVVTASELFLRSAPNRGSQVIRVAHRGERVSIFCKTTGQNVQGNNLWYLLTDGTWAWGAARYIDTIGPTPRWC